MRSIFIFRRDLRIYDNRALELLKDDEIIPIFIFDPKQIKDNEYKSDSSLQFMIDSLKDLDRSLRDKGSKLYLFYGNPIEVLQDIIIQTDAKTICMNLDYTPFAKKREELTFELCKKMNVNFKYSEDYLLNSVKTCLNKGKPYKVFTPYYNVAKLLPIDAPKGQDYKFFNQEIEKSLDFNFIESFYVKNDNVIKGGRSEALKIIERDFSKYDETRDYPFLNTSRLSAHLKFGNLSIREALKVNNEALRRQIYWREFWVYITHYFPNVIEHNFYEKFDDIVWKNPNFDLWKNGETGFPIIDAGMRELNTTGWMHNRVRMLTASFLVKDLMVDWRAGAKYFAQKLVDYCPMQNQNNWQSVAGTGASALAWFRVMNPWLQQEKFDPECKYIKKWIPELKDISAQHIHNWKEDYIYYNLYKKPMLDHQLQAANFIQSLKKSFRDE